eukprot:jgi/Orpsp1_1/1187560/evm.model.d7180000058609.1
MNLIIFFSLYILKVYSKNIVLNAIALTFEGNLGLYSEIGDEFNNYSIKNNLNITVNVNLMSSLNSTGDVTDFASMIESLLLKKNKKYDLYFYDNFYTSRFGKYLLKLDNYISEEHIAKYNPQVISEACLYKNKLVGLPITIGYNILYANKELLTKYDKRIPKTWNELIETSKIIMEGESKNNINLIAYNGLFDGFSQGICSIIEFIHSFRDTIQSPFPGFNSQEAFDALNMIKNIKDEISSDEIFKSNEYYTLGKLMDGNSIFLKYWILPPFLVNTTYQMTTIPGNKEGISAATLSGFNLGICDGLSEERRQAAITAFKYITSEEIQRIFFKKNELVSAITSLYDDEDICFKEKGDVLKNIQMLVRPTNSFNDYTERVSDYVFDFLYENKPLNEALKSIEDLTKIYYISLSLKENESKIGFISLILISIISIIMFFSLIFLFLENYNIFFEFLSIDLWIMSIIGLIIVLNSIIFRIGELTSVKCFLFDSVLFFGSTLNLGPILYKLIINFQGELNFSEWVKRNKFFYFFILFIIDFLLYALLYINSPDIENVIIHEGQNFQRCKISSVLSKIVFSLNVAYIFLIIFFILFFIFIEWNVEKTVFEIRFFVSAIYIDILSVIILLFFEFVISINNYTIYYVIPLSILCIISLSNYTLLYGFKLVLAFANKKDINLAFIQNINKKFINNETTYTESCMKSTQFNNNVDTINNENTKSCMSDSKSSKSSRTSQKTTIISKIIDYHYSS